MKTVDEVVEELIEYELADERKPDEFDASDYIRLLAKRGIVISYDAAYRRLKRKESKGILESRTIHGDKNGVTRVFRIVKTLAIDAPPQRGYTDHQQTQKEKA